MPQPPKRRKLTPRQKLFVEAYLRTRNASQAARDAGYAWPRARKYGSELLKLPHVAEALRAKGLEPPRGVHPRTQIRKKWKKPPRAGLSLYEERFALAYLACGNASEAARRAGIKTRSPQVAGSKLRHRPLVAAFIEKERAALSERARIDAERVLRELGLIAFADIRDIAEWSKDAVAFKPSAALSPEASAAIAELRAKPSGKGIKTTLRLHSKVDALAALARLLGLAGARRAPLSGKAMEPAAPKHSAEELLRLVMGDRATKKPGS